MRTQSGDHKVIKVSVLFLREEPYWVAQGLEYDVTAQGRTMNEAKKAFEKTFVGQLILDLKKGREPLRGVEKAPQYYWDLFASSDRLRDPAHFKIPEPYMINALAEDLRIYDA